MAHSPKMTPSPSLLVSLLRPSSRRFYSFRLQSSFLQCLSCLARARITAVAAAPSSSFRPSIFRAPPPRPPFRGDRGSEAVRRAWFYGSAPSLESWREVGDTVFNSVPAGGKTDGSRSRSVRRLSHSRTPSLHFLPARSERQTFFFVLSWPLRLVCN